jgi:hypothetical protein
MVAMRSGIACQSREARACCSLNHRIVLVPLIGNGYAFRSCCVDGKGQAVCVLVRGDMTLIQVEVDLRQ